MAKEIDMIHSGIFCLSHVDFVILDIDVLPQEPLILRFSVAYEPAQSTELIN